ncbi:MAG: phosphatidate cytidylyltransferase [Chitinophagaceae bacterium]
MPLDLKIFFKRTLTAIAFLIVMCMGLFSNNNSFFAALIFVIQFICFIEYQKLIGHIFPPYQKIEKWIHILFYLWSVVIIYLLTPNYWNYEVFGQYNAISFLVFLSLSGVFLFYYFEGMDRANISFTMLGLIWIILPCVTLLLLRITDNIPFIKSGYFLPIIVFFTMWVNDTMAYVIGSWIGKTTFSKYSPKKTLEGTLGGIICSTALLGWFIFYMQWIEGWHAFAIVFVASLAGIFGDLFESFFKRKAKVKDSGNLLPGHGGFLDRFDSVLFAAPMVWLYIYICQLF